MTLCLQLDCFIGFVLASQFFLGNSYSFRLSFSCHLIMISCLKCLSSLEIFFQRLKATIAATCFYQNPSFPTEIKHCTLETYIGCALKCVLIR